MSMFTTQPIEASEMPAALAAIDRITARAIARASKPGADVGKEMQALARLITERLTVTVRTSENVPFADPSGLN
jgi:hypothetical protein